MKAIWNDVVVAESDDIVEVEGNAYFPLASLKREFVQASSTHTVCPWKGRASYYSLVVNGKTNADAAWYYPHPSPGAEAVADRVAFWRGVKVHA
jgi:uncharacterized protein (DUF427 family)